MSLPLVLLWVAASAAASAYTYQLPVTLAVSRQSLATVSVATADFNKDGLSDIVSANLGTPPLAGSQVSTLSVLLGARAALPASLNEMPLEGNVTEVITGDFTGEGNPDILALTITPSGAKLCTYPGTGAGGFSAPVCSAVSGSPSKMAAADLDKDGRLDIVMIRALDASLTTARNTGGGTFAAGTTVAVPVPSALALGEWNGDGLPDAAVISRTGVLTLLLSGPAGLFQTSITRSIGAAVSDVAVADLNRDSLPDIVLTDPQLGTFSYTLGRTEANGFLGPIVSQPFAARGATLRVADLNADGFPEVVSSTAAGMLVISSNPDGSLNIPNPPGAPPVGIGGFAIGDFDGDSRPDLAVQAMSTTGATVYVLLGQSTATAISLEASPLSSVYGARIQVTVRLRMATLLATAAPLAGASVQLLEAGNIIQTVAAAPVPSGTAELANARLELSLPVGTRELSARFQGNAGYSASTSEILRLTVAPSPSTVRLVAGPTQVSYSQGLRVNANVTGALVPANEGIVRLLANGAVVAQGLVSAGVSQLSIPPQMPLGTLRVKLAYEGANFLPSESAETLFSVTGGTVSAASAASYRTAIAPDSLAVLAVPGLVRANPAAAAVVPWPLSLAGVQVETRDPSGASRSPVGLTYAGSGQINVHIPPDTPTGPRRLVVFVDGAEAATGELTLSSVAPGLFTANGAGSGPPAAYAALYRAGGTVEDQPVFSCAAGQCTPQPMDAGSPGDSLILTLFGTGWRGARAVTATVDGLPAEVLFSGPQPGVPGLDQANVRVPADVRGRGEVSIVVIADGVAANGARILVR